MTRLLLLALLIPACFARTEETNPTCYIPAAGPQAMSCGDGGCQATFCACEIDPTPRLSVEFAAVEPACVHFPEFAEWRCYWSAE